MCPDRLPLASNQLDIWYDQQANPGSPVYNIGGNLIIQGQIDYALLNQSVNLLADEYAILRLSIYQINGTVYQSSTPKTHVDLEFHDFSQHADSSLVTNNWLEQTFAHPFSIKKDSLLWHFALVKESANYFYLMAKFHHLIADGWTTKILFSRLVEHYNALLEHRLVSPLPNSPEYLDFIDQERHYLSSKQFYQDEAFWQHALPSLPAPVITHSIATQSGSLPKANIHRFKLKRDFYNQLNQFALNSNSTVHQVILSTFALYFARIYQQNHIVIGSPSLNRSGAKFKQVPGMFASISPVVLHIDMAQNIQQFLSSCASRLRETYRHQRYPINLIHKRLELIKNSRDTLFDLVISYEKQAYTQAFTQTTLNAQQQISGIARYPLAITLCEFHTDNDVEVILEGAETTFNIEGLQLLASRIPHLLEQLMLHPDLPLKYLDLLPDFEKQLLSTQFNSPHICKPPAPVIVQFEHQAKLVPNAIAIEADNKQLSYRQLELQSNQLAHQLLALQVDKHSIVAICMLRCPEMILAILAVLKVGAAYLPIDPDTPDERIADMLAQSDPAIIFSMEALRPQLTQFDNKLLTLDNFSTDFPETPPNINIDVHDTAYIIFTSGSTGTPKGVMVPNAALSLRINWIQKNFNLHSSDRIGQTIQFCFDPSILETFMALTQGATLVLAPNHYQTAEAFTHFIVTKKISALALVPSSLRNLLQGLNPHQRTSLKVACCGGEVLAPELATQFQQQTNAELFNVYGPTEATLFATAWRYQNTDKGDLPIGRPIDNTNIYIFDKFHQQLPLGVTGEIVIGGSALASAYLNDFYLSQEKFITDPFSTQNNARLYKTGDIGYISTAGQLHFLGRIDRQVKISGYRIELGEIEALLNTHPKLKASAVTVIKQKIYAYIETSDSTSDELIHTLSQLLRSLLPIHMQVYAIIPVSTIPYTHSGKIDYAALPVPDLKRHSKKSLPTTLLEIHLSQFWQETLNNSQISIDDNFFELGGNSLAAITLIQKIEHFTGYKHSLALLLKHPTIAQQADYLSSELPLQNQPILRTLSDNPSTTAVPFYLAASGKGDSLRFKKLATSLKNICCLHMLHPAEHHKGQSITHLATEYAEIILIRNEPPGYIGGFSIGGFAALETARILAERGAPPLGVLLLDTLHPHKILQSPTLFRWFNQLITLLHLNKLTVNGNRLNIMLTDPGITTQLNAITQHEVKPFSGPVALLTSAHIHPKTWLFSKWYKTYGSKLQHYNVSGFHGGIFQEHNINSLSVAIRQFMKIG